MAASMTSGYLQPCKAAEHLPGSKTVSAHLCLLLLLPSGYCNSMPNKANGRYLDDFSPGLPSSQAGHLGELVQRLDADAPILVCAVLHEGSHAVPADFSHSLVQLHIHQHTLQARTHRQASEHDPAVPVNSTARDIIWCCLAGPFSCSGPH